MMLLKPGYSVKMIQGYGCLWDAKEINYQLFLLASFY